MIDSATTMRRLHGKRGTRRLRPTLLLRLLAMFALGGLFGLAILFFGERALHDAAQRLEYAAAEHVKPLAASHRLQTQANALRMLELELPQVDDFFAMAHHLERMEVAVDLFSRKLTLFLDQSSATQSDEFGDLEHHWLRYRTDLEEIIALARRMELKAASDITSARSLGSHAAISSILREVVMAKEQAAEDAYRRAVIEHERQRRYFLVLSLTGFAVLGGLLLSFARSLARRLRSLRDAASALAVGEGHGAIDVSGRDEIAELAVAFNMMQDKVVAREQWLRAAQEELEDRVKARTYDLGAANARLHLLSEAIEQSPIGVLIASMDGDVVYANRAYSKVTGIAAEVSLSGTLREVLDFERPNKLSGEWAETSGDGTHWETEQRNRRPDGSEYWEHLCIVPVFDQHGKPAHQLLMREDISERKAQEEKVFHQAYYDTLTGLPNRILALDRLRQVTIHAQREGSKCVAMFLDLDNFKQINDTLGHAAGDTLLCEAATRLRGAVRDEDTIARLGGDEFLVIISGLSEAVDAERIARKILKTFDALFCIEGREFSAAASIGLAVFPDDGTEPSVLLRNADLAMYEAKASGRNTYRFFNQKVHDESVAQLEMERMLRGALQRGELSLNFQPLVCALDGSVVGAEALLRWDHPQLGRVPPDRFIPIAERSSLIVEIGAWVLDEACAQSVPWRKANGGEFVIAVNVSPRQFSGEDLVGIVRACIERYAIPPRQLEIEVTEGLLIRNASEVREALLALEALGVAISLDDFGTGYSSINYLRCFPFHTIKIDKSFVNDLSDDAGDRALVVAAIRMAHALGLKVIAEGVETDAQRQFLVAQNTQVLQGYLFGRPKIAGDFTTDWFPVTAAAGKGDAGVQK